MYHFATVEVVKPRQSIPDPRKQRKSTRDLRKPRESIRVSDLRYFVRSSLDFRVWVPFFLMRPGGGGRAKTTISHSLGQ